MLTFRLPRHSEVSLVVVLFWRLFVGSQTVFSAQVKGWLPASIVSKAMPVRSFVVHSIHIHCSS